jgi:hypothetical protein
MPLAESLDEQRERLQRRGAQIEVITPDEAMKAALMNEQKEKAPNRNCSALFFLSNLRAGPFLFRL